MAPPKPLRRPPSRTSTRCNATSGASGKSWGVLTNGRSFRLMRVGLGLAHLRFDLVSFLESLRGREVDDEDRETFRLFFYLFGPPAAGASYLDRLWHESDAEVRRVRDVLRTQAHEAVSAIATGFLTARENGFDAAPSQETLDHVRELALVLLYRLLFVLKAEAQNLLPMRDELGQATKYANFVSTAELFKKIDAVSPHERSGVDVGYAELRRLFELVDQGAPQYEVPAYNGGLFDKDAHRELERLTFHDDVVHRVLATLIYVDGDVSRPVPYEDLDVRDFGDIYEGLLEQRLVKEAVDGHVAFGLRNEKGERKASGSYFTPDGLVEQLVDRVVGPLLDAAGDDADAILSLRIVDPAMGSGHFLVKVVDRIAWRLTLQCDPAEPDAPRDNGPDEYAYWKRKVVEHCVYGVDVNPMAVELAKVALWLHTASRGKPLSFLDHHLKCGNSLVGARLSELHQPRLRTRKTKKGEVYEPRPRTDATPATPKRSKRKQAPAAQLELVLPIDEDVVSRIVASVRGLVARPSDSSADVKAKSKAYAVEVEGRLAAHRMLADLHCLQWFVGAPTKELVLDYEAPGGLYQELKAVAGLRDDAQRAHELERLEDVPLMRRLRAAREEGYGPRLLRFFHWELEFPEVAFDEKGRPSGGLAFDGVVGNPPWDKIKAATRDFYGPFSPDVQKRQGPSLDALTKQLDAEHAGLDDGWKAYVARVDAMTTYLSGSGEYVHQVAVVNERKTGGDPDLFRYFVERAAGLVKPGGRWGLVVPTTLLQAEGCTGLRRLLLRTHRLECAFSFENYRKWAFDIHSSFKFTVFVATRVTPTSRHSFEAAFMLRSLRALDGLAQERLLRLNGATIESVSPGSLAFLDFRAAEEARLVEKLHATHVPLASTEGRWSVEYQREVDLTNDATKFRTREFLSARGCTRVLPTSEGGKWRLLREGPGPVAGVPEQVEDGGEYWIAAVPDYYRSRGYTEHAREQRGPASTSTGPSFSLPTDRGDQKVIAGARYTPLYEGRMVHLFDHAQKAYVSGEARTATWLDIDWSAKRIVPRVFVCPEEVEIARGARVGFCDVTGATNERSMLVTLLPPGVVAGNTVPVLLTPPELRAALVAVLASFTADYLLRLRIGTHLNWTYVRSLVVPRADAPHGLLAPDIAERVARLSCTTPELSGFWSDTFGPTVAWTRAGAETTPLGRATLRAELDAIVADAYGLSVPEFA